MGTDCHTNVSNTAKLLQAEARHATTWSLLVEPSLLATATFRMVLGNTILVQTKWLVLHLLQPLAMMLLVFCGLVVVLALAP